MNLAYRVLPAREQGPLAHAPYDCWRSLDGDVVAQFCREPEGYLVRFLDLADMRISADRCSVECTPVPGHDPETVEALYFNQIVPLLLAAEGRAVLHASAVAIDGCAVAFMGPTGRGKSTLAAAFARAGYPFLTDDGLILEKQHGGYSVLPRRPFLRLRADSAAAMAGVSGEAAGAEDDRKRGISAGAGLPFLDHPVPLAAIYLLGESTMPDKPQIAPLPAPAALAQMMQHGFILDVEDQALVGRLFGQLADLAGCIPLATLDFSRSYDCLPGVLDALLARHSNGAP